MARGQQPKGSFLKGAVRVSGLRIVLISSAQLATLGKRTEDCSPAGDVEIYSLAKFWKK